MFVEPSWINLLSLEKMAKALGADKLMFSSDMPQNTPGGAGHLPRGIYKPGRPCESDGGTALRVFDIPLA